MYIPTSGSSVRPSDEGNAPEVAAAAVFSGAVTLLIVSLGPSLPHAQQGNAHQLLPLEEDTGPQSSPDHCGVGRL